MAEPHYLYSLLLLVLLSVPFVQGQNTSKATAPQTSHTTISTSTNNATTLTSNSTTRTDTTTHASSTLTSGATSHIPTEISKVTQTEHSTSTINATSPHASESTTNHTSSTGSTYTTNKTNTTTSSFNTLHPDNATQTINGTSIPAGIPANKGLSDNPGLIAVLCIFFSILAIVIVVSVVKFFRKPGPGFEKLDEVPMNGMNEEAPFARYPPK
ncbi:uncharacterized protein LOC120916180 [Rana temporaria]|uniref:uncharacterized protein LOC120916180 n=1 Tax=Rana temporaria TaxID=8407 RepID=UPI001AAD24E4|nr:uncharacterized protein LOC120916180 [Rana temporaria]